MPGRGLAPSTGRLPFRPPTTPPDSRALGLGLGGPADTDAAGLGVGGTRKVSRQGVARGGPQDDWPPSPALALPGAGCGGHSPAWPRPLGVLPTCHCHVPKSLFSVHLYPLAPLGPSVCLHPFLSL